MNEKLPSEQLKDIRDKKRLYEISLAPFVSMSNIAIDFLHFRNPLSFLIAGQREAFIASKMIRYHIAEKLRELGNTLPIKLKPEYPKQKLSSGELLKITLNDQKHGPVLNPLGPFTWHVLAQTYFLLDVQGGPEGFYALTAQDIQGSYYHPTTPPLGEFTLADVMQVWPVDDATLQKIEVEWLEYVAIHAAYKPMTHVYQMH